MFEYLRKIWLSWKVDRMFPEAGVCPHCEKPVTNATAWIGRQPYHSECVSEAMGNHQETIECPNCGSIETATVEHDYPFNTYIHHCSKCEYIIMESEWEPVTSHVGGR